MTERATTTAARPPPRLQETIVAGGSPANVANWYEKDAIGYFHIGATMIRQYLAVEAAVPIPTQHRRDFYSTPENPWHSLFVRPPRVLAQLQQAELPPAPAPLVATIIPAD